jgi:hypothetical protein
MAGPWNGLVLSPLCCTDFRQDPLTCDRFWGETDEGLGSVKQDGDIDLDEGDVDQVADCEHKVIDDNNDVDDEVEVNDCESTKQNSFSSDTSFITFFHLCS